MDSELRRLLDDAHERLKNHDPASEIVVTEPIALQVQQFRAFVPVSCCVMTDTTGDNHCDHPLPPRPAWHRRLRWRMRWWISRQRMWAGSWIAGVDLDREDDW